MKPLSWPEATLVLTLLAAAACTSGPSTSEVDEIDPGAPRELVSEGRALLAEPVDLDVGEEGRIFILDARDDRVLVIAPNGELESTIGRSGEGPGELLRGRTLGIAGDELRVYDMSRSLIHLYDAGSGAFRDTLRPEIPGFPVESGFAPDGRFTFSGPGTARAGALVGVLDPAGQPLGMIGDAVNEHSDFTPNMFEELADGRLPEFMRNLALPVLSADDTVWAFLQSESLLRHYTLAGELLSERPLRPAPLEPIEQEYFDWWAEQGPSDMIRFLEHAADARLVSGSLWILWAFPREHPALITIHDEEGAIRRHLRLELPDPGPLGPAWFTARRRFAVDEERGVIYVLDALAVQAFELPGGW